MMKNLMKTLMIGSIFLSISPVTATDQADTEARPLYNEEEFQNYLLQKEAMKNKGLPEETGIEVQKKGIEGSKEITFTCPSIFAIRDKNTIKHMGIIFEVKAVEQKDYPAFEGIYFNKGQNPVECQYEDLTAIPKFSSPEKLKCGYYSWNKETFKTEDLVPEYSGYDLSNDPITCIRQ